MNRILVSVLLAAHAFASLWTPSGEQARQGFWLCVRHNKLRIADLVATEIELRFDEEQSSGDGGLGYAVVATRSISRKVGGSHHMKKFLS